MAATPITLFWFRRDLRLQDNAGLYQALKSGHGVLPLFIFDTEILTHLPRRDARVEFILLAINKLRSELQAMGSDLLLQVGAPLKVFMQLLQQYELAAVYANRDYEPQAKARDAAVQQLLKEHNIQLHLLKDQTIFDGQEVLSSQGQAFKVFTPYKNAWLARLQGNPFFVRPYPSEAYLTNLLQGPVHLPPTPSLAQLGFTPSGIAFPTKEVPQAVLQHYAAQRDYPATEGTSRIGIHLRFGTVSIRQLVVRAQQLSGVYLSELIWRDFYMMILDHFPHVSQHAFKPEYERIPWRNAPKDFERWCEGQTGYPLVDAGMHQLSATGYMHNRVRMVTASFLTKHLLISWQLGEAYFAEKLLDYELASNNGGWQWAAGTGVDAAPYFRIFNPTEQAKKFDPQLEYIQQWVPEVSDFSYPPPMVDHAQARARALQVYKAALLGK